MGHVTSNIGGVYEYYKTYDQAGAVYTHVSKAHQKDCMDFLHKQLFQTPYWMIDNNILNKIEAAGMIDRLRRTQVRYLNDLLDFGRLGRVIENEALHGSKAYKLLDLMNDLQKGIWSEVYSGHSTDTYRRNLQRAYIDRMEYLMTEDQTPVEAAYRSYSSQTRVMVSQSDIRSVVRASLEDLMKVLKRKKAKDDMTSMHFSDAAKRIEKILKGQ